MRLFDAEVIGRTGGHLRRMGHDEHLALLGQPGEPLADRARDRAADAAIDLVEDQRARAAFLGERDLECEDEE